MTNEILVMNRLIWEEGSTKVLFHDETMLGRFLRPNDHISFIIDES